MLSPQYLVWLVPLAPFGGVAACALLVAALVLAQTWYFHYHSLWAVGPQAWTLLARNLVLVALYAVLLWKTSTPSRSKTSSQSGLERSRASAAAAGKWRDPVGVARARLVGSDPGRVAELRQAQHLAAGGEVRAEDVRGAHDRGTRNEPTARSAIRSCSVTRQAFAWKSSPPGTHCQNGTAPSRKFATTATTTAHATIAPVRAG